MSAAGSYERPRSRAEWVGVHRPGRAVFGFHFVTLNDNEDIDPEYPDGAVTYVCNGESQFWRVPGGAAVWDLPA